MKLRRWPIGNDLQLLYDVFDKYKDIQARDRYDFGLATNTIFRIGLKEECKDKIFYRSQYPLNHDKKLALIYDTLRREDAGVVRRSRESKHNMPILFITKPIKPNKDSEIPTKTQVLSEMKSEFDNDINNITNKNNKNNINKHFIEY